MDLVKCLIATLLLPFSSQSLALFMPDGFTVSTDTTATADDSGCGSIAIDNDRVAF